MRCLVLDDYQQAAARFADRRSLPVSVEFCHAPIAQAALATTLAPYDILVIMRERTRFSAELLAQLPNLKLLITSGMRNAAIDVAAAHARGITVCGTQSQPEPPAELTWALILALCRHIAAENRAFRESGAWQSTVGTGLAGKTLGLLGLGKIGSRVAKVAQAFDMQVIAWSPNLTRERCAALNVRFCPDKNTLLESSDIVSIHLVLGERSRKLIDSEAFAHMRRHALLINTSRAAIVDETALVHALQSGQIAGAALDVFLEEPLPVGHILRSLPNLLATPHLGYVCDSNYRLYFPQAVENIRAWLQGAPMRELI